MKIPCLLAFFCAVFAQAQPKIDSLDLAPYLIKVLPENLQEISGLAQFQGQILAHNDGGHPSELFFLNPKGEPIQQQTLPLANVDWEAIASHQNQLFIGDFGNNLGQRKDLQIHELKYDIREKSFDFSKTFHFHYPEQKDFSNQDKNHNFDAESLVYHQSKLHIFTKNWQDFKTTHYALDLKAQNPVLQAVESFDVAMLVTDACTYQGHLYLLGYDKETQIWLQVFKLGPGARFFEQPTRKYLLGAAIALGQAEALLINAQGLYVATEALQTPLGLQKAKIYHLPARLFFTK
jgi:hypothetical protein